MRNRVFQKLILSHASSTSTAVYIDGQQYTYQDLLDLTSRFCAFLQAQGLGKGQLVVLAVFDSLEFIVAFLACIRLGIIVSPVDPQLSQNEWKQLLAAIQPQRILATKHVRQALHDPRTLTIADDDSSIFFFSLVSAQKACRTEAAVEDNDPALIIQTSGTTGEPKGVVHTYQSLLVDHFARNVLQISARDRVLSCSRLWTSFALNSSLLFPFQAGAGTILSRTVPNPTSLRELLIWQPTLFFAVPSIYELLLQYASELQAPLRSVRRFIASGDTLYSDILERWQETYQAPILEGFGASEMKHIFISNRNGTIKPNSCGTVVEGFEVRFDQDGRMRVRGPSLASGYYADAALTKARFVDGWFYSDDLGSMDDEGYVFIKGRGNLVYKVHGMWVSVVDIEETLRRCPLVSEAMVRPTRKGLEYVVVLQEGCDPRTAERGIRRYAMQHRKTHELPRAIHLVEAIPKTRSGKMDRRQIKNHASM